MEFSKYFNKKRVLKINQLLLGLGYTKFNSTPFCNFPFNNRIDTSWTFDTMDYQENWKMIESQLTKYSIWDKRSFLTKRKGLFFSQENEIILCHDIPKRLNQFKTTINYINKNCSNFEWQ